MSSETRAACCSVVGNDDDGVVDLEFADKLLDGEGGDGVEGGGRFVHQHDFRLDRDGARDAEALLLPAGQVERARVQAVLHLVPQRGLAQ